MRVVMMGRSLRGRVTGVTRYTEELTRALARVLGPDLTVLLTRAPDGLDDLAVPKRRAPFPTPNEYTRALWEQAVVPAQVRRLAPDVYHSPNYILPVALGCPSVVTVHDLELFDRSLHRLRSHLYLSALTTRAVRQASAVICVSEATREALIDRFPDTARKARVVTEGVAERFRPAPAAEVAAFRRHHGLHRAFVLFVGTVEPRKNLDRLVRAFSTAMRRTELPHDLVIVGQDGWRNDAVWRAIEESPVRDRIRVLGYLDDAWLPAAYSAADALAYPSLTEGFGLPPVEAMACGTATLTSHAGALPETVGDAAHLVDPLDTEDMASGLVTLLGDARRRERLVTAGLERAARYRWDHVADRTLDVFREVVS